MKRPRLPMTVIVFALLAMSFGTSLAQERLFVGSRNLGMGGTGVASTTDAMSVHFNPAGMAFATSWDLQIPLVTVDAELGGDIFDSVDSINDRFDASSLDDIQARFDNDTATPEDLRTVLGAFLYDLPDLEGSRNGADLRGISGPVFRYKNWGVSVSVIGNGGVDTTIDLNNGIGLSALGFGAIPNPTLACGGDAQCIALSNDLIAAADVASGGSNVPTAEQAQTLVAAGGAELLQNDRAQEILTDIVEATATGDATLANNNSGVLTTTFLATQFAGSYSHMIYGDELAIGGNLKVLQGEVARTATLVSNLETGSDTFENALDDITDADGESSTEFALDLGLMWRPTPRWSVGLVGFNLNAPTFDLPMAEEYELQQLFRVGGAFAPFRWFNVALDVDLNELESQTVRGLDRQFVNLGVEFIVGGIFSGWLGAYENIALDSGEPVYTGGIGLRFGRFQLGLSAAVASEENQLSSGEDDDSFPSGAAASFTIGWMPKRVKS